MYARPLWPMRWTSLANGVAEETKEVTELKECNLHNKRVRRAVVLSKLRCYNCGKEGFTTRDCPKCAIAAIAAKRSKKKKKANNSGFGAFQS